MLDHLSTAHARRDALLPIVVSLAIVLAGCGGGSGDPITARSPAAILTASQAAAESASSVRVVSASSEGGLSLDLDLELAGDGGRGRLSLLGASYEAIRTGNTLYVKGNPAFYRRLFRGKDVSVPRGVWLKAPADTGGLAGLADLTDLRHELRLLLASNGRLTRSAGTAKAGRKLLQLEETGHKLFDASIYIDATGRPYPVEILDRGRENGHTDFTGWNQPVTLSAPANTIALSSLEQQRP